MRDYPLAWPIISQPRTWPRSERSHSFQAKNRRLDGIEAARNAERTLVNVDLDRKGAQLQCKDEQLRGIDEELNGLTAELARRKGGSSSSSSDGYSHDLARGR